MTFSFDVYLTDAWVSSSITNNYHYVSLYLSDENRDLYGFELGKTRQGVNYITINVDNNSPPDVVIPYDLSLIQNQWANLSLVVDNGTGTAQAYLNGVSLGDPLGGPGNHNFYPGALTDSPIIYLDLAAQMGGTLPKPAAYVDNVSVSIVPEPGTLTLLTLAGLSGLAMAWIRRRRLSG
jgi:hypothetical protein